MTVTLVFLVVNVKRVSYVIALMTQNNVSTALEIKWIQDNVIRLFVMYLFQNQITSRTIYNSRDPSHVAYDS